MTTPEAEDHDREGRLARLDRGVDVMTRIVQELV
jgi:hypothetical protein